jgi:hypothetical protein
MCFSEGLQQWSELNFDGMPRDCRPWGEQTVCSIRRANSLFNTTANSQHEKKEKRGN